MNDTVSEQRTHERAENLRPRTDWIFHSDGDGQHGPHQVLAVLAYSAGVKLAYLDDWGTPQMLTAQAGQAFRVATDAEKTAAQQDADRYDLAEAFGRLIELISNRRLPLPTRAASVDYPLPSLEAVQAVAKATGLPVVLNERVARHDVHWPHRRFEGDSPVVVEFFWYDRDFNAEAEPAAEPYGRDVDNGDPNAVIPEGVNGLAIGRAAIPEQTAEREGGE